MNRNAGPFFLRLLLYSYSPSTNIVLRKKNWLRYEDRHQFEAGKENDCDDFRPTSAAAAGCENENEEIDLREREDENEARIAGKESFDGL